MAELVGYSQLQARLHAVGGAQFGQRLMNQLARQTIREAKILVPRKTGNLGRSIHATTVTATTATVVASAHYAVFVEHGTRAHDITPNARKALRWAAAAGGRRLSGSPTKAALSGAAGGVVFATRVHHPGTRAQPFLLPAARKAAAGSDFRDEIITAWNTAA